MENKLISEQLYDICHPYSWDVEDEIRVFELIQQVKELEYKLKLANMRLEIDEELEFRRTKQLDEFKNELFETVLPLYQIVEISSIADKYFGDKQ